MKSNDGNEHWLFLLALGFHHAGLASLAVGQTPLFVDEANTLSWIEEFGTLALFVAIPTHQPHLPLYYVVLDAWRALVGPAVWLARVPSIAFGVLTVWTAYGLAVEIYDRAFGLAAAAAVATAPLLVFWAHEIRMYALLAWLATLSTWLLVRALEEATRRRVVVYVVVALLLAYTHVFGWFTLAGHAVAVGWAWYHDRTPVRPWLLAGGAIGVGAGPAVGAILAKLFIGDVAGSGQQVAHLDHPPTLVDVGRTFMTVHASLLVSYGDWWPAGIAAVGLGALLLVERRRGEGVLAASVLVPVVLAFGLSHLVKPIWGRQSYFLGVAILLIVLWVRGLWALWPDGRWRGAVLAIVVVAHLLAVPPVIGGARGDYPAGFAYVEANAEPEAVVIGPAGGDHQFRYRARHADLEQAVVGVNTPVRNETLCWIQQFDDVWVVTHRDGDWRSTVARRLVDRGFHLVDAWDGQGLRVLHYNREGYVGAHLMTLVATEMDCQTG